MINLRPLPLGPNPGSMGFVLFKNNVNNGEHDKIVTIDGTGRSLICDSDVPPTVHYLPTLFSPKFRPFSLTVGFSLYVMDTIPIPMPTRHRSFEVLSNDDDDHLSLKGWQWSPLDPSPHVYSRPSHRSTYIDSYAVVAGTSIVVSHNAGGRTYRFDTASKTWRKAGNWVLPFTCLAEYVPEHKLWFGVSSTNDGNRFCAADLVASPDSGEMRRRWCELGEPPPEWSLGQTYAVHLGSSRFCIVRFFVVVGGPVHVCPVSYSTFRVEEELQAVINGVEVEGCGGDDEGLRVVKHKSERYKLDLDLDCRMMLFCVTSYLNSGATMKET
uniref:F-box associated domain-containing protein n=1 Tax=Setaria viridis TaxID=4556 RepID=A0A4U6U664_SETVI|nr:hypothetical protein SEVIR_6G077400v2 [Setaria viridis]